MFSPVSVRALAGFFPAGRRTKKSKEKEKNRQDGGDPSNCYLLLIVSKPSRTESKGIKRRQRQSGVDADFTCWDVNLSITDVTQQLPDVGLRSDGRGGRERERETDGGLHRLFFKVSTSAGFMCGYGGKTKYAAPPICKL